jgi:hypothetical protein
VEIAVACKTIRAWNDFFLMKSASAAAPDGLPEAVFEVKRYLENTRADGKPIRELDVATDLLYTPEAIRWVMPFVFSAESLEASRRRAACF